ncbi:LOW QUALITY PROTEIN: uncharacterized protein AAES06_007041 [Glossophaga mutica]
MRQVKDLDISLYTEKRLTPSVISGIENRGLNEYILFVEDWLVEEIKMEPKFTKKTEFILQLTLPVLKEPQRARVADPAPGALWVWIWTRPVGKLLGDLTEPWPQLPHQRDGQTSGCAPTPTSISAEGWRAMEPEGGVSSDLFGSPEEGVPSNRPNRIALNIFGPTAEPQNILKEPNPQGERSCIFEESTPVHTPQCLNPPGGKTSNIFGSPVTATLPLAHPNKPKDHILLYEEDPKLDLKATTSTLRREELGEKGGQREADYAQEHQPTPTADSHELRLGPWPQSHSKVLKPPGDKSSISFYQRSYCFPCSQITNSKDRISNIVSFSPKEPAWGAGAGVSIVENLEPLFRFHCHHESHRGARLPDCQKTYLFLAGGNVTPW